MPKDEFVAEDPMQLVGMVMPGEPGMLEAMAAALVEEYVLLGWDETRLMTLFVNPLFLATHRIYRQKGEAYVRELVRETCARFRIPARPSETTLFGPDPSDHHAYIELEDEPVAGPGSSFVPSQVTHIT
jgi:hypothetical protein